LLKLAEQHPPRAGLLLQQSYEKVLVLLQL
jgi:hypothetical protein